MVVRVAKRAPTACTARMRWAVGDEGREAGGWEVGGRCVGIARAVAVVAIGGGG